MSLSDTLNHPCISSLKVPQLAKACSCQPVTKEPSNARQLPAFLVTVVPHPLLDTLVQQQGISRGCQRLHVLEQPEQE